MNVLWEFGTLCKWRDKFFEWNIIGHWINTDFSKKKESLTTRARLATRRVRTLLPHDAGHDIDSIETSHRSANTNCWQRHGICSRREFIFLISPLLMRTWRSADETQWVGQLKAWYAVLMLMMWRHFDFDNTISSTIDILCCLTWLNNVWESFFKGSLSGNVHLFLAFSVNLSFWSVIVVERTWLNGRAFLILPSGANLWCCCLVDTCHVLNWP